MIKTVYLKNYKCYGPEGARFDLKPLTFLYGTNGAGKSTFLQGLLKLRDWEKSRYRKGYRNDAFLSANYVFKKQIHEPIEIGVTLSTRNNTTIKLFKRACLAENAGDSSKYENENDEPLSTNGESTSDQIKEWKIDADIVSPAMTDKDREHALEDLLQMRHLGAKRQETKIAKSGQASSLVDLEQPEAAKMEGTKAVFNAPEINRMLAKIGFSDYEFINHEQLKDKLYDVTIPWKYTGAGIHNIAFTLDAIATLLPNGILLLEEPETHMDPKYLKAFAEVIVETIKRNKESQIIVECHSEHLMLAIQGMIRIKSSNSLSPSEVTAIYIERTQVGSSAINIGFNEDSSFTRKWPGGFYQERWDLITMGEE